ncbi:unnamed protein product, partial [Polarella glacialis]
ARSEMRKELAVALRNTEDLQHLRHVIFAAKRSCLPQAEVAQAERALEEAERARQQKAQMPQTAPVSSGCEIFDQSKATLIEVKEPRSAMEFAVVAKDKDLMKSAIAELKASGMSTREISQLHARAMLDFGSRAGNSFRSRDASELVLLRENL